MDSPAEKSRQKCQNFVVSDTENSVEDFYRIYRANIPQIIRIKEGEGKGGKFNVTPVKKSQTFFVHKVCREKRVTVDVMKRGKKCKTISVPVSHPARFCLAGSDSESPDFTMKEILDINTFPCDVIVSPRCHFRIKLGENKKMKDGIVLRLKETYEETYLLGNPITEATISKLSDEVVQISRGPTLNVVTGIEGFAGEWSTYLQLISNVLTSHQIDSCNSGMYSQFNCLVSIFVATLFVDFTPYQDYNPSIVCSDSHPIFCNYVTVSRDFHQGDGHKYEDLQKLNRKRKDYEIIWIPTTGKHLCDTRPEIQPKLTSKSKKKSESTSDLYDVGWDPVTGRALLNGEILNTSAVTEQRKSATTPRDYKPEVSKNENFSKPSPEFQKSSILISDLPKPKPKKFLSLRKAENEKPDGQKLHKLRKARSEDGESGSRFGQLDSNSNDFHSEEKAIERMRALPTMSISDVTYWLKILKIKCVDKFVEQAVDGALLMDLSDDLLMSSDFGMSRIEVFKLRKFIKEGYVPKP
ncbi:uncharacterized protein LOC133187068 [Saccostrea echinata]|uniref:uncharacterized protein LOC133187068 n=1 Tax=Saccostrea echinata TaxID=191078 RepID=UPI002A7F3D37|nr:uncharacterized protein LOC133187068 [Saccostrea echinata]